MKKDPTAFRKRFAAWKEGKPVYNAGKILKDTSTNAEFNDDGTFTDKYTRLFEDVIVTPKGIRLKPESIHKYLEPWDEGKFLNIITLGGLNNLSPSQWARRAYDFQNGKLTAESWLYGNNGVVPDDFARQHPNYSLAANTLFDFWALGGNSLIKNARNYAELGKASVRKHNFSFLPYENKLPVSKYTGNTASDIINKEELGFNSEYILNPNVYLKKLLLLPKPNYLDETFVDRNGNVNVRNVAKVVKDFYRTHPNAKPYKYITNSSGNLYLHIKDVVKSAQSIPVPEGYTRQELVQSALFHDIGKVLDPSNEHGHESVRILDKLGISTSDNVKNAVYNHMTRSILDKDELTKALHFADVARGLDWDNAAFRYPHLTYNFKKPELNIPNISFRDELKTRINPWLRNKGYLTIGLDLPEEEAWKQLEDRIDQHLSFLRGVRDPVKQNISSPNDVRNAENSIKSIMDLFGLGYNYASSQDASEYRMRAAATNIPLSPTSAGRRSHLYDDHYDSKHLTEYDRTHYSDLIGANPKTKDALYLSTSDDVAAQYGTANTDNREGAAYIVRLPKKQRTPGESMSEHLLKNDFDMIDLNHLKGLVSGSGAMFEDPYRLLTGRSLVSDMRKEGIIKPKYIANEDIVIQPGGNGIYNRSRRSYLYFDNIMEITNDRLQKLGIDFLLKSGKNGNIYMPKELIRLYDTILDIEAALDDLTPTQEHSTEFFDNLTRKLIGDLDLMENYNPNDPSNAYFNRLYLLSPLSNMDELLKDALVANLDAMQDPNYLKYAYGDNPTGAGKPKKMYKSYFPNSILKRLESDGLITKKQISATRKAYLHDGDATKYIDFKRIANKALTKYLQSIKENAHKKMKIDPKSLKPTVQLMIDFMHAKGVRPRYEIEGYGDNKVFTIEANSKNKTKNKGDIKRTYGYVLGDKGLKRLDLAGKIEFDKKYNPNHIGKDDGSYSKNKISRKTLRTIGTAITAGSTLKRPNKNKKE